MYFILNKSSLLLYFLVISSFIVYGCSSSSYVPVEQHSYDKGLYKKNNKGINKAKITYHYVRKKDTLYSIAWQYGLDFKDIARWNSISKPYLIYIGQRINLRTKAKNKSHKKIAKPALKIKKNKKIKKRTKVDKNKNYKKKQATSKSKKVSNNKKIRYKKDLYKTNLKWAWPVKGKIIQSFNPSKGKKGIDISVIKGAKIKSSESGKVVYSGHGLTGYGLLIIVKHNNNYLSAYAHNSKLLVEEGDIVKRKQTIALAGKTATARVKLHFEIRKNGKPVNPLHFLR